jgi:putative chitinase
MPWSEMYVITNKELCTIMPEVVEVVNYFIDDLNEMFVSQQIMNGRRMAAFLAQAGHESVRFSVLSETFNYSVKGLLRVYPQLFTPEQAQDYAFNPMRIANRVYAGKFGNGDEQSGDGWRFRGRGLFPAVLVGRSQYQACSRTLLGDPDRFSEEPWQLARPEWAVRSAGWVWQEINGNELADDNNETSFRKLTRRINKGNSGMQDRIALWMRGKEILRPRPGNTTEIDRR